MPELNSAVINNFNDFAAILIVGAVLSLIIEWIKGKYGPSSIGSKLITILLSIAIGAGYVYIRSTPWFPTIVTVLTTSSAVYALFLKPRSV